MLLRKKNYLLSQIGNAVQTPTWFNMMELNITEHVSERSVQVRTSAGKQ
jgi:hypothetical protein